MLTLDTTTLLFSKSFLKLKYKTKILEAFKNLKIKYENNKLDFLKVDELTYTKKIKKFVKDKKDDFENIVVLWIWGSALGTKAIMQALKWKYYNELSKEKRKNYKKLYILDNIDPDEIQNLLDIIDLKKSLFIVISKSGSTIETISEFSFFKRKILETYGIKNSDKEINKILTKHFVIVAWENSSFKKNSLKQGFEVFDIPEGIWWRFSVLTSVGLLPLAFIWIDIDKLLSKAKDFRKNFFSKKNDLDPVFFSALINFHSHIELWKNILVLFPYVSNLFFFWEWYKQLLAESLWKQGLWLTPATAIWVTDQHSQLQLYYDWPNDKIINFIELEKSKYDFEICCDPRFTFKKLLDTEKYWTGKSITDYNKINYSLKIDELNEENIWELILFYELQIAIMAEFFWVNAFDQPWVEIGKNITKKKLLENIWKLDILEQTWTKNIVFIGGGNGQSSILKNFKEVIKKKADKLNTKFNIVSVVAMSDDWRTTWMLMRSFKEELGLHLPPPWDLRRILFTLSNSKFKDFFEIIFNRVFLLDDQIKNYTIKELFEIIAKELLEENKILDLKKYVEEFLEKKWEIYKLLQKNKEILDFVLPLKASLKWHKFWNILMASLYYNFDKDYEKMLEFMKKFLEVKDEVLPITVEEAYIKAILKNGEIIETQDKISNVANYNSAIEKLEIIWEKKPKITKNIKKAIKKADYIIIGPGDLYTSIIANFLVEWLAKQIEESDAKIIYILNANNKKWETTWYKIQDFVKTINNYLWGRNINYLVWNAKIPELTKEQLENFKNDISVKWWDYLILDNNYKQGPLAPCKIISWEYINPKDLYKYNEKLIEDLILILK